MCVLYSCGRRCLDSLLLNKQSISNWFLLACCLIFLTFMLGTIMYFMTSTDTVCVDLNGQSLLLKKHSTCCHNSEGLKIKNCKEF